MADKSTDKPSDALATPLTDEEVETAKKYPATSNGLWVSAEFARDLERQLRAALHDLVKATENHTADLSARSAGGEFVIDEHGKVAERINEMGDTVPLTAERILALLSTHSASERTDNARLLWLETLLKHCPHADLTWNDDADEGPLGWRLLVESCSRLDLRAPTLEALIDLGMKAEPDEDGDVVANATDAVPDRKGVDRG